MARTSNAQSVGRRSVLRRFAGWCTLALSLFQFGCYSYLPLQTELPRSPEIRVLLNDRGRVAVGEAMGPFVEWIEGSVAGEDSSAVRVRVTRVVYTRGGTSIWTGEEVTVPRAGILGFQGRQFSKARSWALAGLTAAIVVYSILSVNFDLFNDEQEDRCTDPTCGPNTSVRW